MSSFIRKKVLWPHNFDPAILNSGNFVHTFARGMKATGYEVCPYYLGTLKTPIGILRAIKRLKQVAGEYDLIHTQFGSACALVTALAAQDKYKLLTLRGSDWYRIEVSLHKLFFHGLLANFFSRISLSCFQKIICVSNRLAGDVLRKAPNSSVYSLPDPIDLNKFKLVDRLVAKKKFGNESDLQKKWVLFTTMSLANPIKRADLALKAFEIANEKLGNLKLCIASGIAHDKMPEFVGACDLIILTSSHEGWPNCIKEALACNIPFVSTDVSDLSLIANQEPLCRICRPDPYVLAKNICDVLTSQKQIDLRKYVLEMDLIKSCENLCRIYEEC